MLQVFLVSYISYLNNEKTSIVTSVRENKWETLKWNIQPFILKISILNPTIQTMI